MITNDGFERFGVLSRFALDLKLLPDPDGDVAAPQSSVGSWGQWRMWVDGINLCEHDLSLADGRIVRQDAITWYLAPLLFWIASNWAALLHEERLPFGKRPGRVSRAALARDAYLSMLETRGDDLNVFEPWQEWASRHGLRWSANGGIVPDIFLRRLGDDIEVNWGDRWQPGGEAAQFLLETGVAHVPVEAVGLALDSALAWCAQKPEFSGQPWFQEIRAAIDARTRSEQESSWIAWYVDGAASPGRLTNLFMKLKNSSRVVGEFLFSDRKERTFIPILSPAAAMFGTLSPDISEEAAARLLALVNQSIDLSMMSEKMPYVDSFVESYPAWQARSAWDQGYALAESFLEEGLVHFQENYVDLDDLLRCLDIRLVDEHLGSEGPRGVALAGKRLAPTIVVNIDHPMNRAATGSRFTIAHELCHILFDRDRAKRITHVSTPWAPAAVEQRANAFSAMLLMPRELVHRVINDRTDDVSLQSMEAAAKKMRVGLRAMIHHLANLDEISDEARDRLLEEIMEGPAIGNHSNRRLGI